MNMIIATHNAHKIEEFGRILAPLGITVQTAELTEAEETGTTFRENAYIKAKSACDETGLPCVADDSGLSIDYLNGEPGVYSARYAPGGHDASDKEKYEYLLKKLEGVENRRAKFVSSICCIFPNGDIIRCEGECTGKILLSPRGEGGFGYDPVFMPTGYDKSMAELGTGVKNEISHRANALKIFKKKLREYNGTDK